MSQSTTPQKPSIVLPVIALVCIFVCWPVGVILSIVSFFKFKGFAGTEARTLSIVALVANVVVIVPIMGIMAAIAIPNFVKFQCRSKQSEAKGNLRSLFVAEESNRAEKNAYSMDPTAIGFAPMGNVIRYKYTILDANGEAFHAEARGFGDMDGDVWVISNKNDLENIDNKCGAH